MPPKRTAKKPSTSSRVTNKIKGEFADAIKDSYTPKELDEMQRWQLQEIAKRLRLHNLAMIAANQSEDKIRKDLKEHYRRRRAPTTEVPPPAQAPAGTGTGTSAAEHARTGTTPPGYPLTVPPSTGSTPVPIPDEQPADAGASAADSQATHTPSTPPGYPTHAPPSTGTTPAPVLIEQSSGARAGAADTQATHTPSTPPGYPADAPPSTGTTPAPLPNQQSTDAGSATADASIQTDRIRDPSPCAGHVTDHRPCRASLNAAEATIANQRETITDARATIAHQRAEIDEASQRIAKLRDTITALRQDRNVAKLRHLRRENEEGRQLAQELFNNQKTWATSMGSMRIDLTEALDIAKSYKRQLEIATAQANRMEAQLDMYRRVYQRDKTRSERERSTYVSERDTYPYRDNQASHQDHRGHPSGIGPVRRGRSRSPSAPYSCPPAPRPSHRPTPSTSGSGFDPSATGRPDPSRFTGSQFPPSLERNADGTQTFFVRSTRTTHGFGAGYRPPPGSESHHSTRHDPAGRPDFGYGASPYFEPTEDYASAPEAGSSTGFGTASEARTYGNPSGPSEFGIGAPPQHGAGFEYDTPSTYTGYPYYQPDSSSGGGPAPGSGAFPSGSGFGWSS